MLKLKNFDNKCNLYFWLKTKHQRIPISNLIWAKILEYALLWPIHGPNYKSLFCNTTIHWYVTFLYIHTLTLTLCIKRLLLSHLFYFWFNSPCKLYIKDKEMAKALMQGAKYRHRKRHEQKKKKKKKKLSIALGHCMHSVLRVLRKSARNDWHLKKCCE